MHYTHPVTTFSLAIIFNCEAANILFQRWKWMTIAQRRILLSSSQSAQLRNYGLLKVFSYQYPRVSFFFFHDAKAPSGPEPHPYRGFTITHRTRYDSSERVMSPTHSPLPDNTQQTDIHAATGFETTILASERPQTYALDSTATGIGNLGTSSI